LTLTSILVPYKYSEVLYALYYGSTKPRLARDYALMRL